MTYSITHCFTTHTHTRSHGRRVFQNGLTDRRRAVRVYTYPHRQGALTEEEEVKKQPARRSAASGDDLGEGMWAKWAIPWDGYSVLLGMVGVEVAYVLASIIAPVMVLVNYTDVDRLPPATLPADAASSVSPPAASVAPVRCDDSLPPLALQRRVKRAV